MGGGGVVPHYTWPILHNITTSLWLFASFSFFLSFFLSFLFRFCFSCLFSVRLSASRLQSMYWVMMLFSYCVSTAYPDL